jgi:hypothetical protein
MEGILFFLLAFLYLIFAGYGVTKLLEVKGGAPLSPWLIPVVGFCLTLVVYSEAMRFLGSSQLSAIAAIGTVFYFNFRYARKVWKERHSLSVIRVRERIHSLLSRDEIRAVSILALIVVVVCGWTFFTSGWGSYWGTGSGDIFDALRGRDLLISNPDGFFSERMGYYDSDPLNWYQYSGVAFWTTLLNSPDKMNVFYLELLLMLSLLPGGIYLFSRESLGMSRNASVAASAACSLSAFYLATYFAGHVGSMICGTVLVYLMYLIVRIVRQNELTRDVLGYLILLGWVVLFTYPYPAPFLFLPLAVSLLAWKAKSLKGVSAIIRQVRGFFKKPPRLSTLILVIGGCLIVGMLAYVAGIALWSYGEVFRTRASELVRAWHISEFKEIWLVYFGLVPSSLPFGLGGFIHKYSSFMITSAFTTVDLYVVTLAFGLWFMRKQDNFARLFFLLNTVVWLFSYFFMRYFIADPYYLYKFLYTTQFLWLILFAWSVEQLWQRRGDWLDRIKRPLAVLMSATYLVTNLAMLGVIAWDIAGRQYNHDVIMNSAEIDALRRYSTYGLFFQYSKGNFTNDQGNILNYALEREGIPLAKADSSFVYALKLKNQNDVIIGDGLEGRPPTTVWQGRYVRVDSVRSQDLLFAVDNRFRNIADSWYAAEHHREVLANTPFRWASYKLDLYLVRPSQQRKFLNFFVDPGPGLKYQPLLLYVYLSDNSYDTLVTPGFRPLRVLSRKKEALLDSIVVKGMSVVSIPLPKLSESVYVIRLMNKAKGRNLLPWEERYLNYQIADISLTDKQFVVPALGLLNPEGDIIHPALTQLASTYDRGKKDSEQGIMLWANWGPLESQGGRKFRWVNNDAQFVILNPPDGRKMLELEAERGPALATGNANLEVLLGDSLIMKLPMQGYEDLKVDLPGELSRGTLITLRVDRPGKPLSDDSRILSFRVYRAFLSGITKSPESLTSGTARRRVNQR